MPDNRKADPRREPNLGRRRLLVVAAGGLMVGLGVVGRGGGSQVSAASKAVPRATGPATARAAATVSSHPVSTPSVASRPAASVTADAAPEQPLYYVDDGTRVIALTIDDGPSPVYTPQVLALLDKYGIQATFSMIGKNVGYYPSVAREVAAAGHTIINHTWDHANLTTLTAPRQRTEIARATGAIHAATGVQPRMFRAPYGAWSKETLAYCASQQLTPLDWSVDPRDWARPGVKEIVNAIMKTTQSGSIILEHDGGGDRSETVAALKIAIPRLIDQGYQFTIP
jgi:peptidoglycan-N-acetylglucosamine deacetylase